MIIGPLPPPYAGPEIGTEMFLQSDVLQTAFDLSCINTTVRTSNSEKGKIDGVMVLAYVRYVYRLLRSMLFVRPDVVLYRPTTATLKGWVRDGTTLFVCWICRVKVVLQFGGGHFRFFYDSLGSLSRAAVGWLLARSSVVLAESNRLRAQFRGLVPESRVGVLPTAISQEFFEHFEGLMRSPEQAQQKVLFVGHLSQAKGYCDLLKVVPELAAQVDVRFCFIGAQRSVERNIFFNQASGGRLVPEDPIECYKRYIANQGLDSRMEFLGDRVQGKEKLDAFAKAAVFVLPSYSEGFSRAILEAMAAGLPMVVTRVGAVPDIVEDGVTGFIIEPGDVAALNDRIKRLLEDPALRARMGAAAREYCRTRFLAERVAAQVVDIVQSLL